MKEQQFRNKTTWFTFVFSLLVVWVHSYNAELYLGRTPEGELLYQIEHWIGETISQFAVPGFFVISAYLFYRNFTWDKLGNKWNSRIRSILVPFIVWNFIYYICYVIGSRLPWMTDVVGKGIIPFSLTAAVDAVLHYTYNYVFWYLYQLILLILLTPAIYLLLKQKYQGICFQLFLWGLLLGGFQLPQLNLDALIYYCFAAYAAQHGRRLAEHPGSVLLTANGAVIMLLGGFAYYAGLRLAYPPLFVICRLFVVTGLWISIPGRYLPEPRQWIKYNFFLYATHFAVVRFINKAGARVFPAVLPVPMILFLLMPIVTLVFSCLAGGFLRRRTPWIWELLNGGR
ncbi:MAG: acyltransferase family protein [Lachnospiraceae bacterium]